MAKDYVSITRDISAYTSEMRKAIPQTMQAFYGLSKSAGSDGHVDAKTKELIALAKASPGKLTYASAGTGSSRPTRSRRR